jgi:glycosyltransferase involved in cell wall biosynthesis
MARGCLPPNTATIAGIHNHAEDFYGPWSCSEMYGAMIRAYLDRADVVWAPDETIQKDLVDKLGVTADKAIVIRNPIVVDGDAASADREYTHEWLEQGIPAVLCFEERESPESMTCLFEALSLARQQEDVRCLVLGNRDRRASLAEAAARLGIERSVEFVDEPRNPRPYFRKSLAYVHPAVAWEGSAPTALSRAVADGCAVISSKSANATRDLIGASERGLLVPMKDAEALAEAMLQLVWDGEFRQKLVARARAYLDSVSPRSTVRRFDEVIADCVRERRAAAAVSARASSPESDVST